MAGEFKREDFLKLIEESHSSYRMVGFTLMTTIIGLSAAIRHEFNGKAEFTSSSCWFLSAFFVALIQETVFYLASLLRARHSVANWEAQSASSTDTKSKKAICLKKWSDQIFNLSDSLCFLAVVIFLVAVFKLW